ncbi:MAG: aspartate aminotransferase family protein [Candidatus Nanopelagicales bacterium]
MSDNALDEFLNSLYPYRGSTTTYRRIAPQSRPRDEVLAEIRAMAEREDAQGDEGTVSGSLYSGDHEHYHFLSQVFEAFAHANVLQRDMYPSATKFEGEIVAMTASMLHGEAAGPDVCGVLTGGGSESLITALYTYREQARETRGVRQPNVVIPVTAHVALDKGAHWLGIEMRHAPLADDYRADVAAMADLVDDQTIAVVGSAGNYGHGLIDPIEEVAALAQERGIGMHVDGCLGGFLLPWVERLGYDIPPWDFRVPGVTSISADTHKFGYALKGTSVLVYRNKELRRHQYFTFPDWPGGLYLSPGFAGSRSGGLIASTWAAMVTMGEDGYLAAAQDIMRTADIMKAGIRERIPELEIIGEPTFLIAFRSDEVDVYLVNDALKERGWRMNALQLPPALHFCVTRPNTQPGLAERFVDDLRASVDYALERKGQPALSGAMYGLGAGTPQGNEMVNTVMSGVIDAMYEPAPPVVPAGD